MFKVTIKQYVIPLCALVLIAAVLNSGCLESSTGSTATANGVPDMPIQPTANEKVLKTTPDGLNFFEKESDVYVTNTYRGAYDTDNDGKMDVIDSAVAAKDGDFKKSMESTFKISLKSRVYQICPDMKEFRTRSWFNDNNECEKIEIFIDGEFIHSTTRDLNKNGDLNIDDVILELGWKNYDANTAYSTSEIIMK